ncbi:kinesin [Fusarium sp. NRRL 52700]|nr:kinesin [Fusarium sp. NRRL 52700]
MEASGVTLLRDEVQRQISLVHNHEPQGSGVVTVSKLGAEYISALQKLIQQLTAEDLSPSRAVMLDHLLLWNIPSFCGPYHFYLDSSYMRESAASRYHLKPDPSPTFTDVIWRHPQLTSWLATESSTLLLLQGDNNSSTRIGAFGARLAEHIGKRQPVAYVPTNMIEDGKQCEFMSPDMAPIQIIRHIVIQALRRIRPPNSMKMLLEITRAAGAATTSDNWFDILEGVLALTVSSRILLPFNIILHFESIQAVQNAQTWPQRFQTMFERIRKISSRTVIRVMFISSRSVAPLENMLDPAISCPPPTLPINSIRPFPNNPNPNPRTSTSVPPSRSEETSSDICFHEETGKRQSPLKANSLSNLNHRESTAALVDTSTARIASQPNERREFNIAIFCALQLEADAVICLLDQKWGSRKYGKVDFDDNHYTLGAIGIHKIVLVHLPGMGKVDASRSASSCRISFPGIRLALVVGICGGVPFGPGKVERVLGDVVISNGLVQYDFGRQFPSLFKRKRTLHENHSRPASEIRSFLARLGGREARMRALNAARQYLLSLQTAENAAIYQYPGVNKDILHEPSSLHKHPDASKCPDWEHTCGSVRACDAAQALDCHSLSCHSGRLVTRQRLKISEQGLSEDTSPIIYPEMHIGTVASGDKVMKSGEERDKVSKEEGIIAFEMEASGIWENFPCIIIKGICDYADCHKNKIWQDYAAATAAAYMKAVLDEWD